VKDFQQGVSAAMDEVIFEHGYTLKPGEGYFGTAPKTYGIWMMRKDPPMSGLLAGQGIDGKPYRSKVHICAGGELSGVENASGLAMRWWTYLGPLPIVGEHHCDAPTFEPGEKCSVIVDEDCGGIKQPAVYVGKFQSRHVVIFENEKSSRHVPSLADDGYVLKVEDNANVPV
jgi:hypothetical protein